MTIIKVHDHLDDKNEQPIYLNTGYIEAIKHNQVNGISSIIFTIGQRQFMVKESVDEIMKLMEQPEKAVF